MADGDSSPAGPGTGDDSTDASIDRVTTAAVASSAQKVIGKFTNSSGSPS